MTITEETFDISAPELFAVLTNPDTYPHWLVGAKKIRDVSAEWPERGSSFKHTVGFGPIAIPDRTTVRSIESPRMFEMLVRARPAFEAVVRFDVTATATGCDLRMTETPVGIYKFISPVAQPLIRARNERSLKRLRAVVESLPDTTSTTPARSVPENEAANVNDQSAGVDARHATGVRRAQENADNESPA